MSETKLVERGEEYLPEILLDELEKIFKDEKPGKSRDRLQAAVLRKSGQVLCDIAKIVGRHKSTVSRWLLRMARGGLGHRHDKKSPGRPRKMTPEQDRMIESDLDKPPSESGFSRGSWNSRMVARRILDRFSIVCSPRTALRIAHRLGFSVRKPRPVPYNSASLEEQENFIKDMEVKISRWQKESRVTLAIDAATLRDSPASRRGLRRRGGSDTVKTNYSKKPLHLIGTLGDGTLDMQFHEGLKADNYIELIEYARRRHGKIGIIADNASAITGTAMADYIYSTDGEVEMVNILPHTPQLNPIEIQWREIKAALADLFFGGLGKMRDAIIRMFQNKEIAIVKMFDWLLPQ